MRTSLCPNCGYDLTGLSIANDERICPECGKPAPLLPAKASFWRVLLWIVPLTIAIPTMTWISIMISQPGSMYRDGFAIIPAMLMLLAASLLNGFVSAITWFAVREYRTQRKGGVLRACGYGLVIAIVMLVVGVIVAHVSDDPSRPNAGGIIG